MDEEVTRLLAEIKSRRDDGNQVLRGLVQTVREKRTAYLITHCALLDGIAEIEQGSGEGQ